MSRPDWNRIYWQRFVKTRDRLRRQRREGLNNLSEGDLLAQARDTASRQVQESINRWAEEKGLEPGEILTVAEREELRRQREQCPTTSSTAGTGRKPGAPSPTTSTAAP